MKTTKREQGALDWIVETMRDKADKQPDEFTAIEAHEEMVKRGLPSTIDTMRHKLNRMAQSGQLENRKIKIGRYYVVVYRKP